MGKGIVLAFGCFMIAGTAEGVSLNLTSPYAVLRTTNNFTAGQNFSWITVSSCTGCEGVFPSLQNPATGFFNMNQFAIGNSSGFSDIGQSTFTQGVVIGGNFVAGINTFFDNQGDLRRMQGNNNVFMNDTGIFLNSPLGLVTIKNNATNSSSQLALQTDAARDAHIFFKPRQTTTMVLIDRGSLVLGASSTTLGTSGLEIYSGSLSVFGGSITATGLFMSTTGASFGVNVSSPGYTLIVSTTQTFYNLSVSTRGYPSSHGAQASLSSCGSSTVVGDNTHGTVTVTGVVTSCIVNFGVPFVNTPVCVVSDNSTTITPDINSVSNSALTLGFSASLGGGIAYYHCASND